MQVAHVQDHITHAVMGANTAVSFGISESAEFFNILSNTLYSDKPLAVGREILCNAWDAHIKSKRTHLPVEVVITDKYMTIKDRGTGIPKDQMHAVYCVYGASTKVDSDDETGGFGLGCKAPFAYGEHFEVTNCNAGVKTIYRISKNSGEVGGKPGLMEIMSCPTDEVGIEVRIELKDPYDGRKFEEVIRRIAAGGEMNVTLNGQKLPTLPFSEAKEGYLITSQPVGGLSNHKIFVRYGAVIYPVEQHENYWKEYQAAQLLLGTGMQSGNSGVWRLVLQAQPKTISITPSRETISMTDRTIETLGNLLKNFNEIRDRREADEVLKINKQHVNQAFLEMKPAKLFTTERRVIGLTHTSTNGMGVMTDFSSVARSLMSRNYPTVGGFRQKDIELRLRSLIASGFGNRGKIQSFLSEYLKANKKSAGPHNPYLPHRDWFHHRIVAPLLNDIRTSPDLSEDRLLAYGHNESSFHERQNRMSYDRNQFYPVRIFKKNSLENYLPFLRNIVILSTNRADVTERASYFPEMKYWFGSPEDSLVYVVHRSDNKIAAAKAFFKERGFTVVDLTKRYKGEPEPVVVEREPRVYKPRKTGLPVLSSILPQGFRRISTDLFKKDDVARIEKPEFVVRIGARVDTNCFEDFTSQISEDVVRLFGARGGIAINQSQVDKFVGQGAKTAKVWLFEKIYDEIKNNKKVLEEKSYNIDGLGLNWYEQELMKLIFSDEVLKTYYELGDQGSWESQALLRVWEAVSRDFRWSREAEVAEIHKLLKSVPTNDNLKKVAASIKQSPFKSVLSTSSIESILDKTESSPSSNMTKAKARDFVIAAIAG